MANAPYLDPKQPVEARVEDLLSRMSTEEKVGQMTQLAVQPYIMQATVEGCERGEIGSILCAVGEQARPFMEAALRSRLGIPLLVGIDAIHGHSMWHHATMFPSQLALSHSWDEKLCEDVARATAVEVAYTGIHWTFSPVLCLPRDLRWGRINETFGEDNTLIARLAVAMIRGYQGNDLADPESIAACAKHYVGYGESEGGRDGSESQHSWRTLRSVYLPPFEAAAKAGVATFMSAYHAIDGVPVAFSKRLLDTELRHRYGYEGVMVTDWNIIGRMHTDRRICATLAEGAARALRAGNDMAMTTPAFYPDTLANLADGRSDIADVDKACRRILALKFRLGLFENPRLPDEAKAAKLSNTRAHRDLALRAARQSLVLLKNRGVLPLDAQKLKSVAVIGPNADDWINTLGDWTLASGQGHGTRDVYAQGSTITVLEGLRRLLGDRVQITHSVGCGVPDPAAVFDRNMPRFVTHPTGNGLNESAPEKIARAVRLAEQAEVVVLVLGDRIAYTGEQKSTATLELPGDQQALFDAVLATGTPVVVVLMSGKPLAIPQVAKKADAILLAHSPGMEGGTAVAEALFGLFNPNGKLTLSWPHHVGQCPVRYDQAIGAHQMGYPDLPDANYDPLFAFGFGLSYSRISFHGIKLARTQIARGESVQVEVVVGNRSNSAIDELVQCYLNDRYTSVVWPVKKLKQWQRVSLAAGEQKTVRFELPFDSLALCDEEGEWVVEDGEFEVLIGNSSRDQDLQRARFSVA